MYDQLSKEVEQLTPLVQPGTDRLRNTALQRTLVRRLVVSTILADFRPPTTICVLDINTSLKTAGLWNLMLSAIYNLAWLYS